MYITEANSSVIDLAAFKANANIDKALLELKKPQSNIDIHTVVDNLQGYHTRTLNSGDNEA